MAKKKSKPKRRERPYEASARYEESKRPPPPPRDPTKVYFQDIPQFTRHATYKVDVSWRLLEFHIQHSGEGVEGGLDLDPDFQRAHVWTELQQVRYVEYVLRGGASGKDLYFNCRNWNKTGTNGPYVIVDGKQRLHAVRRFLAGEIPAFGHKIADYGDEPDMLTARFHWHVNDLDTREEVLQWYLDLNRGGTMHTDVEIAKVESLLLAEKEGAKKPEAPSRPHGPPITPESRKEALERGAREREALLKQRKTYGY